MSTLPAQPRSVLRGHKAQVHAAAFVRGNERLATGDADGYVVLWDLTIRRPRAVWQPHTNAILGIAAWGEDKIITHGRDHHLIVWRLDRNDEISLSTRLPLEEGSISPLPQPWIVHIIEVNTMNFCSFGICIGAPKFSSSATLQELLVAVPNTLASESVDIFHLPSQQRRHTIHFDKGSDKNGMVMALTLCWVQEHLTIIAGFENGLALVSQLDESGSWNILYRAQVHSQPVLSLDVHPDLDYFLTSGADALIVKHPIPHHTTPRQQSTIGDSFAQSLRSLSPSEADGVGQPGLLAEGLAHDAHELTDKLHSGVDIPGSQPTKVINTKHSGQQGLRIRSDGKVFATAGWDSRVRVYSSRTMRELAVLKWHQVGCYTVAFADLNAMLASDAESDKVIEHKQEAVNTLDSDTQGQAAALAPKLVEVSVKERRISHAKTAHWLAAGSKDGKVSLWDVY